MSISVHCLYCAGVYRTIRHTPVSDVGTNRTKKDEVKRRGEETENLRRGKGSGAKMEAVVRRREDQVEAR